MSFMQFETTFFFYQITMLSRNTENFKVTFSVTDFYVIEDTDLNDCGTFKFAAHVTKQETINNLSVIWYGLHELELPVPGNTFLRNVKSLHKTYGLAKLLWVNFNLFKDISHLATLCS